MFEREASLTELAASVDDILKLLMSLNSPAVALEGHPTDEADATICTVRQESGMVSTYVYLCLHGSGQGVFYRYEVDPYPEDLRGEVETKALSFAESLGFIMDDTHFHDLGADDRKDLLERCPFSGLAGEAFRGDAPGLGTVAREASLEASMARPGEEATGEAPVDLGAVGEEALGEPPTEQEAFEQEVAAAVEEVTDLSSATGAAEVREPADPESAAEDPDFERAIREFIEDSPQETPAEGGPASAPLSRFKLRSSEGDIYAIRGRAAEPAAQESAAEAPADEPSPAPADPERKGPEEADPAKQARRAKARYLASF